MAGLQFVGLMGKGGIEPPSPEWYGTGEDGDVIISANTNLPVAEDIGHIFKQYNSLTINAGFTLKPANRCAGMVLLVRGDCIINGTISMDLMAPRRSDESEEFILTQGVSSRWLQKISTLVGGKGGNGGLNGGAGGNGHRFGGGYAGGGSGKGVGATYKGGSSEPRPLATMTWPFPATEAQYGAVGEYGAGGSGASVAGLGGSSPGGGGGGYFGTGAFGTGVNGQAYGGGIILIVVGGILFISENGKITANGGKGGRGASHSAYPAAPAGSGGGAGGGVIAFLTRERVNNQGALTVNGGISEPTTYGNGKGQDGSVGTIYSAHLSNSGEVTPW